MQIVKEFGGFFELELPFGDEYYPGAIKLNSARHCLQYILQAQQPDKVHVPSYCCTALLQPLIIEDVNYEFYNIDYSLEIKDLPEVKHNERLLYTNYFGLKNHYIKWLVSNYGSKLIVDNAQAFFASPIPNIDIFYSPRKFFGVPDGGYLFTQCQLNKTFDKDVSIDRMYHLLGRIDCSAADMYNYFKAAEKQLQDEPIKYMSNITQRILASIEYDKIKQKRENNFQYMHDLLGGDNCLPINFEINEGPLIYPFMPKSSINRSDLANNYIYIPKYWTEALDRVALGYEEKDLIQRMLPLPIDQRLNYSDLERVVEKL